MIWGVKLALEDGFDPWKPSRSEPKRNPIAAAAPQIPPHPPVTLDSPIIIFDISLLTGMSSVSATAKKVVGAHPRYVAK
jgi:hypothetical protein